MQDKFEQNIKSRLQHHEIDPPPMSWQVISNALDEEKPKVYPWHKWLGIAAAIALPVLLTIGYFWFSQPTNFIGNDMPTIVKHSDAESNGMVNGNQEKNNKLLYDSGLENNNNAQVDANFDINHLSSNGLASQQAKENRVIGFFNEILGGDHNDSGKGYHRNYVTSDAQKHIQHSRRTNIHSVLTAPFRQPKTELSSPELYAFYQPKSNNALQITTFNMKEDKKESNENKKFEKQLTRFEINPFAGAAILGSFDNQSLIAPEFNQMKVESKIAANYGAKASYKLNDRLKIRSGVSVIDITQNTYEVPFKINNVLGSVNYNMMNNTNISPDFSGLSEAQLAQMNNEVSNISPIYQDLEQNLRMIEVPLEAEYRLTKGKKLNVAATGGLSTLIRDKNEVYALDSKALIASPTNVKSVSFSANAGVKMDYKISEKLSVNVEPQMKYLINTVTGNDEIQPYLLGVNAGISYSL